MGYTFTKLFSGLTESTVWVEPYATRVLWVSMLSWADQHGRVFGSLPGIARRAGINLDECEAAMVAFMSPDRHSRTPDNEGRRIEKIEGGWRLLNYAKYREMRDAENRREQNRLAKQRERDRARLNNVSNVIANADSQQSQPPSAQAEAEAEAEAEEERKKEKHKPVLASARTRPSLDELTAYCLERRNGIDPQQWMDHYSANGWKVGRNPMKDWRAAVRTWERSRKTDVQSLPELKPMTRKVA